MSIAIGGKGGSLLSMIKALAHVCVFAADLERSRVFYCEVLGLKRHFDFLKEGKLFGFYLAVAPGQFLEIFSSSAAGEAGRQRIHHFCLEVGDIQGLRVELVKRGVAVSAPKLGCDGSWQCWCKDPDGTEIEFQQYTGESAQFSRRDCVVDW